MCIRAVRLQESECPTCAGHARPPPACAGPDRAQDRATLWRPWRAAGAGLQRSGRRRTASDNGCTGPLAGSRLFGYAQPPGPPAGRRLDLERKSGGHSACPPSRSGADTGQRMISGSTTGNWPRIEQTRATAAIPATTSLACMIWPPPCNHWASCPPCNARPRHPNAQYF